MLDYAGSTERDKAIAMLTQALAPAHSPAAAARRLEAALNEVHDNRVRRFVHNRPAVGYCTCNSAATAAECVLAAVDLEEWTTTLCRVR